MTSCNTSIGKEYSFYTNGRQQIKIAQKILLFRFFGVLFQGIMELEDQKVSLFALTTPQSLSSSLVSICHILLLHAILIANKPLQCMRLSCELKVKGRVKQTNTRLRVTYKLQKYLRTQQAQKACVLQHFFLSERNCAVRECFCQFLGQRMFVFGSLSE